MSPLQIAILLGTKGSLHMNAIFARPDYHADLDKLTDRHLLRNLAYINGRWSGAADGESFEVCDPASGRSLAWVAAVGEELVDTAIDAALAAQSGWAALMPHERGRLLRRWYELIIAARDDLALILTLEQGKPIAEALGEVDYAAEFVEWYAEEGKRLNAEGVSSHLPGAEMIVRREPLGVVAVVTPWNFPSAMITRKVAAALAAGCTVVIHPSAYTPLSALALAELAERAGIPAGVCNIVTGDAATIVPRMTAHPQVRALSFTGSTEVGRLIAAQSAPTMKRLVMELGGHAPACRLCRRRSGSRGKDRH
jgi:aspartate-semialdehyde dehydrogenase